MTERQASGTRKPVFISYRRKDAKGYAYRLADRLKPVTDGVFIDVESIPHGERFDVVLENRLRESAAVIVVIGAHWAGEVDGENKLQNPRDYVRWEIAQALALGLPMLPVLVDGGSMPNPAELPEDIREFATLQALTLHESGFDEGFAKVESFLARSQALRRPAPGALREWGWPVLFGLFESILLSRIVATVAAPLVPWRHVVVDTWYAWLVVAALGAAAAFAAQNSRRIDLAMRIAAGLTFLLAVALPYLFPGVRIVIRDGSDATVDEICDGFETDTRLYARLPGVRHQGPPTRPSFCQGEAFTQSHFEILVRTGWWYRNDLTATVHAAAMPAGSSPPVRIADIAVQKSLSVKPPFLEPEGERASFHAVGVPATFVMLMTCWYEGSVTRPAALEIFVDLVADNNGIMTARQTFPVDW